jgi:DNA-binding transcriptional LysR family regulator
MSREDVSDLLPFLPVARERSFTRAPGKLVVSQSALSQAISRFKQRFGLRFVTRTRAACRRRSGRAVADHGRATARQLEAELRALRAMRDKPAPPLITTSDRAANALMLPKLSPLLRVYTRLPLRTGALIRELAVVRCNWGLATTAQADTARTYSYG